MNDSEEYKELKIDERRIFDKIIDGVTPEERTNYTVKLIRSEEENTNLGKEVISRFLD